METIIKYNEEQENTQIIYKFKIGDITNIYHNTNDINSTNNVDNKNDKKKKTYEKKKRKNKKKEKNNKRKYIGMFRIYAYCPCSKCCGKSTGITRSGTRAKQGKTIAVDPSVIPLGSTVYIQYNNKKHKYIAEDTGSGINGNKIDMFKNTHNDALQWGVKSCKVWIKTKNEK